MLGIAFCSCVDVGFTVCAGRGRDAREMQKRDAERGSEGGRETQARETMTAVV